MGKRKADQALESLAKANERGNKHSGDARYEASSKSSAREAGVPEKALPPIAEGRSLMWWLSLLALLGCAAVLLWRKRLANVAKGALPQYSDFQGVYSKISLE